MLSISVIIPVHNSEEYLEKCLDSVLTQGISDLEIILVENGSTDRSLELCRSYTDKYSFIKTMDIGPLGVSAARNEGLQAASKEWVVFVDSDDCLQPGALHVAEYPGAEKCDVILSGYCREYPVEQDPGSIREIDPDLLQKSVLQYAKWGKVLEKSFPIDYFSIWACWCKFYKRKILLENNIEFPCGVKTGEDSAFCFQVYSTVKNVGITDFKTYFYRVNEGSAVYRRFEGIYDNNMKLIKYFEGYRKSFTDDSFPEDEFNSFVAAKLIEIVSGSEKEVWDKILKSRRNRKYIDKASFIRLIPGKKNSLTYMKLLLKLKILSKRYMFR